MTVPTGVITQEAATPDPSSLPSESAANLSGGSSSSAAAPAPVIDAAAVAAWLDQNRAFFHQHPELLLELSIPHESGGAISLLERQVAVFRERQGNLQDQIHEFIGNARANDNLFEKTRLVVLELLRCTTLAALQAAIEGRLRSEFDASASALIFVADAATPQDAAFRRLATADVKAALGDLFAKQRTYCGALNHAQQQLLFTDHMPPIVSAAIVPVHLSDTAPLRQAHGLPLLLIGSVEEQHFNGSLDTLFLDFIGEVLAAHMQNLAAA